VLDKPEGFQGTVTLSTQAQATRGAGGDPWLKPPPGLEAMPELYRPIGRTGARSVGSTSYVLDLDVDEASRRLVTPENALRLRLPPAPGEEVADLLPVVYDGEDYLLAGYAGDEPNVVELVHLPPTVVTEVATKRGRVVRTLRLFIYKRMGRYVSALGLRRRVKVDGRATYAPVARDQFKRGDRVAIMIHGFTGETEPLIGEPADFIQGIHSYDHILTWDYESFGTKIDELGEDFARALRQQCGFGKDDGITVHVYAHSMGSVVSRCMIELCGGHEMVDSLVMAGPPNRGSSLASVSRGAVYMIVAGLNMATKFPLAGVVNWPLKMLYDLGHGWADLAVDSGFLRKLNDLTEPSNVPYLVLAGDNSLVERDSRLNRLAHKVLDTSLDALFGEENDVVVGQSCLRGVRGGSYPKLDIVDLACDHFSYFEDPESRDEIAKWMKAQPLP
jgi:pimeloyl-ACP methyl ester carboxylesterase